MPRVSDTITTLLWFHLRISLSLLCLLSVVLWPSSGSAQTSPGRVVSLNLCADELVLALADAQQIASADRVIFPGVGAAGSAMASLRRAGIDQALGEVLDRGKPMLGICLGLQISLDYSEENDTKTLGFIPGTVRRFALNRPELKIPHMGWNEVTVTQAHPVLDGIEPGDEFYFVHGYYPTPDDAAQV